MKDVVKITALMLFCFLTLFIEQSAILIYSNGNTEGSDAYVFFKSQTDGVSYDSIGVQIFKPLSFFGFRAYSFAVPFALMLASCAILYVFLDRLDLAFLLALIPYFPILMEAQAQLLTALLFVIGALLWERKKTWEAFFFFTLTTLCHSYASYLVIIWLVADRLRVIMINRVLIYAYYFLPFVYQGAAALYSITFIYASKLTLISVSIPLIMNYSERHGGIWAWYFLLSVVASAFVYVSYGMPYAGIWRLIMISDFLVPFAMAQEKVRIDNFFLGFIIVGVAMKTAFDIAFAMRLI